MTTPVGYKDFFDPTSTKFNVNDLFQEMTGAHQAVTILVTILAGLLLIYPGIVAFRALTYTFRQIEKEDLEKQPHTKKTNDVGTETLGTAKGGNPRPVKTRGTEESASSSVKKNTLAFERMEWQIFWREQLNKQLEEIGKTFNEVPESGDCLFDAVAPLLSKITNKPLTKKDVRQAIAQHLKEINKDPAHKLKVDAYKKMFEMGLENTYESFCENIGKCVEDFKEGEGTPIWGNEACLKLIAEIYHIKIQTYSCHVVTTDRDELAEGGMYEGFDSINGESNKITALLDEESEAESDKPVEETLERPAEMDLFEEYGYERKSGASESEELVDYGDHYSVEEEEPEVRRAATVFEEDPIIKPPEEKIIAKHKPEAREVCTLLEPDLAIEPPNREMPLKGTIELANIGRMVWGHWVPVVVK